MLSVLFYLRILYFITRYCSFSGTADSNRSCIRGSGFGVDMDHVVVDMETAFPLTKVKSIEELRLSEKEDILSSSERPSHVGGPCLTCYRRHQFSKAGRGHNTQHQGNNLHNDDIKALNSITSDVEVLPWVVRAEKVLVNEQRQHEVSS